MRAEKSLKLEDCPRPLCFVSQRRKGRKGLQGPCLAPALTLPTGPLQATARLWGHALGAIGSPPSLFWRGWGVGLWVVLGVGLLIGCSIWCTRKYRRPRQIQFILVFKTKIKKTPLCQRQGLRPSAPTMADSPASNLGADTKENHENRLSPQTLKTGFRGVRSIAREVRCPQRTSKPYRFCRFVGTGVAPACFHGFTGFCYNRILNSTVKFRTADIFRGV